MDRDHAGEAAAGHRGSARFTGMSAMNSRVAELLCSVAEDVLMRMTSSNETLGDGSVSGIH